MYTNPVVKEATVVVKAEKMWERLPCAFVSFKYHDGAVS